MRLLISIFIALLITTSVYADGLVIGWPPAGGTLKDSNTAASTGVYQVGRYSASLYVGGNFTASSAYTLSSLKVFLTRVGTATGTLTARIYSTTAGAPNVQLSACSVTVDRSTVPTSETAVEFTGCSQALENATEYCIIVSSSEVNGEEDVRVNFSAGGGLYTHEMYTDADGTAPFAANNDEVLKFETYGN